MRSLTQIFSVAIFVFCFVPRSHALTQSAHGFLITVDPIIGYELSHRTTPTPHSKGMLIYGARFTAGRPHLAVEGEYTRGSDNETFTSPVSSVSTTRENVRLGVRGTYDLSGSGSLATFVRLGGQATKMQVQSIDAGGIGTASNQDWEIHPYAGAGLQIAAAKFFSLGLEANYVFYSLKDFSLNTVQLAASLKINLNSK